MVIRVYIKKEQIMKKTYISPDMIIANMPTKRILLSSLRKGADWTSGSAAAREADFDLDDEDF